MRMDVRRLYLANLYFLFLCGMVCGAVAGIFCDKCGVALLDRAIYGVRL
jgi:hypothetical protein